MVQFLLSQYPQYVFGIQNTAPSFADGIAAAIEGVSKIANAIGGFRTLGSVFLAVVLLIMARFRILPRLYKELLSQNSTKTKAELKWIKKKYVGHTLFDANDAHGLKVEASAVLKKIRYKQDNIIGIVGKAGLGKSMMLLWLYFKLAKSLHRRCAFIHIGSSRFLSKESICSSIKRQLNTAKKLVPFCKAYIFIDAIDEASHLFNDQTSFDDNFINELKDEVEISNCNIIFTIRDECFQRGVDDIVEKCRTNIVTPTVFKILPMNQSKIIKIFKSFRCAKKIEKRLSKRSSFNLRFQNALPNTKVRKSIKMFERYINNHSDTIFQYPVFMRYANKLMEENDGVLDNLSLDNSLKAIGFLVEKMVKWEFHAIYKTSAYFADGKSKKPEYQYFEKSIYGMIDLILGDMINCNETKRTASRDTVVSAYNLIFASEDSEQNNPLQVAHCLFSWDNRETTFEFHNLILWDYFASKYIYESDIDYKVKQKMFNCKSGNTRLYQSVITIYFQRLYANLSAKAAKELFDTSEKDKHISIITITGLCLTEYYRKLPLDDWSLSRSTGAIFKGKMIRDIIEEHILILNADNMLGINCAADIKELCTEDEIQSLTHIAFHELREDSFDISFLFNLPNLQYVTLPPYHKTFLRISENNDLSERRLRLWHRTPCEKAENRFCDGNNLVENIKLLETVFNLEVEDTDFMGLDKPDFLSTCWTALSLAEAYRNKALYLTIDAQRKILDKTANAINTIWNNVDYKLKYRFCYDYGMALVNDGHAESAIKWLRIPYDNRNDGLFTRFTRYTLACELIKGYIFYGSIDDALDVLNAVEEKYTLSPKDSSYYYRVRSALRLYELKKQYDNPKKTSISIAAKALEDYSKVSDDINTFLYHRYASEFYIIINKHKEALKEIKQMEDILSKTEIKSDYDEKFQGWWIQYNSMLLLYQYLEKKYKEATNTANALLSYGYRVNSLYPSVYKYIILQCNIKTGNADPENEENEKKLYENYDNYRRTSLWI